MSAPYVVYLVRCADGTFYTGITTDISRRLNEHNGLEAGGARYTSGRRPVELVYEESCANRGSALTREYEIKKLTAKGKLALSRRRKH